MLPLACSYPYTTTEQILFQPFCSGCLWARDNRWLHYYKTGLCSRPFVPAVFGPGTIGGFCPGSND